MATLDPTVAVQTCEDALRQLMTYAYRLEYGFNWLEKISSEEQRKIWASRHEQETKKRTGKGVAVVPNVGLAYGDMQDLLGFVNKHWKPIEAAFGANAQNETKALLTRFETLRNTAMHSRNPVLFERELLSGIAGQIRNQVTKYMTARDPAGDHYPRIESVTDSFGHRYDSPGKVGPLPTFVNTPDVVLHPGDVVTFTCVGIDPQGRDLQLTLAVGGVWERAKAVVGGGVPVDLAWTVREADVAQQTTMFVNCAAVGTKYHRKSSMPPLDDAVGFSYRVDQPIGQ